MKIAFRIGGQKVVVDAKRQGSELVAKVDDRELSGEALWLSKNELSLTIAGRSYDVEMYPAGQDRVEVSIGGQVIVADFTDPLAEGVQGRRGRKSSGVVNSPMPGKVVVLLAKVGQKVTAGDGVVVVEAMKMENEVEAPISGVVKKIAVKAGDIVQGGSLLLEIGE